MNPNILIHDPHQATAHEIVSSRDADALVWSCIPHRNFRCAIDEAFSQPRSGQCHRVRLLIGPPGVGKSLVARTIVKRTQDRAATEMQRHAGLIPAVLIEAPALVDCEQSDRLFHIMLLTALGENGHTNKVAYGIDPTSNRLVRPRGMSRNGHQGLRTALMRALKARKTQRLIIDDAIHLFDAARPQQVAVQFERLKALSVASGCELMLVGSYDLFHLLDASDASGRGLDVVEFSRYQMGQPEDLSEFTACVEQFQRALPQVWGRQLERHADALLANCLGCVGSLSNILNRAAKRAQAEGCWRVSFLEHALLSSGQRKCILEEILGGETAVQRQRELASNFNPQNHGVRGAA